MDNLKTSLSNCRSCKSSSVDICSSRAKFPLYIWPLAEGESTPLEDINVYICNDCGYIQLQNMDDKTISEIYRDEAFNIENRDQKLERLRLMTIEDNKKFENTKVLEIGGGRNTFLGVLPNTSEKWVADFSIDDRVKSEVEGAYEGNFIEIDITQKSFDYVFMFHVLEHFNEPSLALEKTKSLLSNKGKIIIEVPNFAYEAEHRPDYTIFHMHISLFTKTSLISLMMRHGFSCLNFFKKDEILLAEFCLDNLETPQNHKEHSLAKLSNADSNINRCSTKLKTQLQEKLEKLPPGAHSYLVASYANPVNNQE